MAWILVHSFLCVPGQMGGESWTWKEVEGSAPLHGTGMLNKAVYFGKPIVWPNVADCLNVFLSLIMATFDFHWNNSGPHVDKWKKTDKNRL